MRAVITVPRSALRMEHGSIVTEASTIGLAPGEWPSEIVVPGRVADVTFGAGKQHYGVDRELAYMVYVAYTPTMTVRLTVLND